MSKVVVTNHLTLDGVMQAPADPDEDPRDGFAHGGWAVPYGDQVMQRRMGAESADGGRLLLGRRTYEHFASVWPSMPKENPYTETINNSRKYVASTTLKEPLEWRNSTLLEGDAMEAVAELKRQPGKNLVVLGSGELVQSLMLNGLVDEFVLTIHPLVLGSGRRLFTDSGASAALRLVETTPTTTGVVIATYQPVEEEANR